jgi:hypothetical protein
MLFMSLLLSVVTLNPAMPARSAMGPTEGIIQGTVLPDGTNCQPGHICASAKTTLHGCFVNNFYDSSNGGTPLTIDVSQTGKAGTTTWIYWINSYYKTISIKGNAQAKYYCP